MRRGPRSRRAPTGTGCGTRRSAPRRRGAPPRSTRAVPRTARPARRRRPRPAASASPSPARTRFWAHRWS
ncbi:MAG: hypothetical protein F4057_12495 [Acidobacteria bacterium]|nr:hypothetical protein [Acidobacteriota bacterium]